MSCKHSVVVFDGRVLLVELSHGLHHQQVVVKAGVQGTHAGPSGHQMVVGSSEVQAVVVHQVRYGQARGYRARLSIQNDGHFNAAIHMAQELDEPVETEQVWLQAPAHNGQQHGKRPAIGHWVDKVTGAGVKSGKMANVVL